MTDEAPEDGADPEFLTNNPAGRLLAVLRRFVAESNQHVPTKSIWAKVLDAEDSDGVLFEKLGFVYALPSEAAGAVISLANPHQALWLRWRESVDQALDVPLAEHSRSVVTQLGPTALAELEFTALELSRRSPDHVADVGAVDLLGDRIEELAQAVIASGVEQELVDFLLDELAAMSAAVADYRIRGARSVVRSCGAALGAALIRSRVNPPATEQGKSLLRRLGEVGAAVALTLTIANAGFDLEEHITAVLEPPKVTTPDPAAP